MKISARNTLKGKIIKSFGRSRKHGSAFGADGKG